VLVLSEHDVNRALPISDCIDALEQMFIGLARGEFFQPLRVRANPGTGPNWMTLMPSARLAAPRLWALKQMVVTPTNTQNGLDPIQGVVLLHDGDDGRLLAVVNAPALTAIRTAAVSALATRLLARADSARVAIIGAGVQAKAHVAAMKHLYPKASFRIWSRNRNNAVSLANESGATVADTITAAAQGADILCTVTASATPVISRAMVAPGCHINAVGSSAANAREIDAQTVADASLFVDRRESTLSESGDYLGALAEGAISGPEHIQAELADILLGNHHGRSSSSEITLFKSLGLAIEDLIAAELAVQSAAKLGIGTRCPW
jgi:ornithine cyclodeaminase/alanine dehydrogenase-like protein (mu-crystallin family)